MARYKEVAQIVLNYRDHRERLVRRSITALLPRIAYFLRDRFVASYLKVGCGAYSLHGGHRSNSVHCVRIFYPERNLDHVATSCMFALGTRLAGS